MRRPRRPASSLAWSVLACTLAGAYVGVGSAHAKVMVKPTSGTAREINAGDIAKVTGLNKTEQKDLLALFSRPASSAVVEIEEAKIGEYLTVDANFLIKHTVAVPDTIGEFLATQRELQTHMMNAKEAYRGRGVTVGLELEFLKMSATPARTFAVSPPPTTPVKACGNNLHGLLHIEIAKTTDLGFNLPIILETDAGDELEMVMPPVMVPTALPDVALPDMVAVDAIRDKLSNILKPVNEVWAAAGTDPPDCGTSGKPECKLCGSKAAWPCNIAGLMQYLADSQKLTWDSHGQDEPVAVAGKNIHFSGKIDSSWVKAFSDTIARADVLNTCVAAGKKSGGTIYEQLNIATDWRAYGALKSLARRPYTPFDGAKYVGLANAGFRALAKTPKSTTTTLYDKLKAERPGVRAAVVELIETAASQLSVPGIEMCLNAYNKAFTTKSTPPEVVNEAGVGDSLTSGVKEWRFVWRKTTVRNLLSVALRPGGEALTEATILSIDEYITAAIPEMKKEVATAYDDLTTDTAIRKRLSDAAGVLLDGYPDMIRALLKDVAAGPVTFPHTKVGLRSHNPALISPRADTYIPMDNVAASLPIWPDRNLFVVELRAGPKVIEAINVIVKAIKSEGESSTYLDVNNVYAPFVGDPPAKAKPGDWYEPPTK